MTSLTASPLPLLPQILEHTPEGHADRGPLQEALERAEELCSQVNEGVREKENSDRLDWIQAHVQCDGPIEVRSVSKGSVPNKEASERRPHPWQQTLQLSLVCLFF